MPFQTPITIKEAVENIHSKKYLLPAIQREVVWSVNQITQLFDSLMRDYPIGSFLFWYVKKEKGNNYQFYEFMRDFHEKDNNHNPKANINGQDDIIGILDGQQRLTSLYIGLKGSYAYKEPKKKWSNPQAFPTRRLYLNLLTPRERGDETDLFYDFSFRTDQDARKDVNAFWFKVGDILDLKKPVEVIDYLIKEGVMDMPKEQKAFANEALFKLWEVVHSTGVINYYLEQDESLDKVLNIFIRVNSGGTILSYSDLLLSIATAQWKHRDARDEIISFVDELNSVGDGFKFDKDLVLKSSLVLADIKDIAFKVDNFNNKNMLSIEGEWDGIKSALRGAAILISAFGYSSETLTSNYVIIPIAYYLKKKNCPSSFDISSQYYEDREAIRRWLIRALVKRVFGGAPDSVLRPIREVLNNVADGFPFQTIMGAFKGTNKSLAITEDDIENMLYYRYGQGYTFSTLALLYPSFDFRNKFHIDHIHPESHFTRAKLLKRGIQENDIDFYLENANLLPNLQLLEGVPNQEKSDTDFSLWIDEKFQSADEKNEYMRKHDIPEVDLSLMNFRQFVEERTKGIQNELRKLLSV
jgi:hypothetical protein